MGEIVVELDDVCADHLADEVVQDVLHGVQLRHGPGSRNVNDTGWGDEDRIPARSLLVVLVVFAGVIGEEVRVDTVQLRDVVVGAQFWVVLDVLGEDGAGDVD